MEVVGSKEGEIRGKMRRIYSEGSREWSVNEARSGHLGEEEVNLDCV